MAPKLFEAGLLTDLDRVPLALYCQAYGDYLEAKSLCASPLIKTTNGNIIQNPGVGIMNGAWKRCLDAAARFGMTPSDRGSVQPVDKPGADDGKRKFFSGTGA